MNVQLMPGTARPGPGPGVARPTISNDAALLRWAGNRPDTQFGRSAVTWGKGQPVGVAPPEVISVGLIGHNGMTGLPEVTVGVLT
jgi:hypothetical protein